MIPSQISPVLDMFFISLFNVIALTSVAFYSTDRAKKYYSGKVEKIDHVPGSAWMIKGSLLITLLASNLEYFYPFQGSFLLWTSSLARFAGMVFGTMGISIFSFAKLELGSSYTPLFNSYIPKSLVQKSLYRYIRHPIYLGNLLIYFGFFLGSGSALVGLCLLLMAVVYHKSMNLEERALSKTFPEFEKYAQETGRLLPKLEVFDLFSKKKNSLSDDRRVSLDQGTAR